MLLRQHRADDTVSKAIAGVLRADLVIIDDIGLLPVATDAAEGLYRLIDAAYEKRSVALSSNLHPSGFDELMPKTLATATVDRLLHHAHLCQTSGDSVRLTQALAGQGGEPVELSTPVGGADSPLDRSHGHHRAVLVTAGAGLTSTNHGQKPMSLDSGGNRRGRAKVCPVCPTQPIQVEHSADVALADRLLQQWKPGGHAAVRNPASVRLIARQDRHQTPVGILLGSHDWGGLRCQAGYEDLDPDVDPASYVHAIWVAEGRRSQGVGAALLACFIDDGAAADTIMVVVEPDATDSVGYHPRVQFFERHGFCWLEPAEDFRKPWLMGTACRPDD